MLIVYVTLLLLCITPLVSLFVDVTKEQLSHQADFERLRRREGEDLDGEVNMESEQMNAKEGTTLKTKRSEDSNLELPANKKRKIEDDKVGPDEWIPYHFSNRMNYCPRYHLVLTLSRCIPAQPVKSTFLGLAREKSSKKIVKRELPNIAFKFDKGFSNAVRRDVFISDF